MDVKGRVALVTGAASGIGRAVAEMLVGEGANVIAIDINPEVKNLFENAYVGDTTDEVFRRAVFIISKKVNICVPCAGITRDNLAVKLNKNTNEISIYSIEKYREVVECNLISPTYWALEMASRLIKEGDNSGGFVGFIGSVSSAGNKGQLSYAATKKALEATSATLNKEWSKHKIRTVVIHPGFTATNMLSTMPEKVLNDIVLPATQIKRLIDPKEVAQTVIFAIKNDAIYKSIWVDGGFHPSA